MVTHCGYCGTLVDETTAHRVYYKHDRWNPVTKCIVRQMQPPGQLVHPGVCLELAVRRPDFLAHQAPVEELAPA